MIEKACMGRHVVNRQTNNMPKETHAGPSILTYSADLITPPGPCQAPAGAARHGGCPAGRAPPGLDRPGACLARASGYQAHHQASRSVAGQPSPASGASPVLLARGQPADWPHDPPADSGGLVAD